MRKHRFLPPDGSGQFSFAIELIGESDIFDVPGLDASSIPDNETFVDFLKQMENLKFVMTGHGGPSLFGQVVGDATITSVSTVTTSAIPEPPTLALLAIGLVGIGSKRRTTHNPV